MTESVVTIKMTATAAIVASIDASAAKVTVVAGAVTVIDENTGVEMAAGKDYHEAQ